MFASFHAHYFDRYLSGPLPLEVTREVDRVFRKAQSTEQPFGSASPPPPPPPPQHLTTLTRLTALTTATGALQLPASTSEAPLTVTVHSTATAGASEGGAASRRMTVHGATSRSGMTVSGSGMTDTGSRMTAHAAAPPAVAVMCPTENAGGVESAGLELIVADNGDKISPPQIALERLRPRRKKHARSSDGGRTKGTAEAPLSSARHGAHRVKRVAAGGLRVVREKLNQLHRLLGTDVLLGLGDGVSESELIDDDLQENSVCLENLLLAQDQYAPPSLLADLDDILSDPPRRTDIFSACGLEPPAVVPPEVAAANAARDARARTRAESLPGARARATPRANTPPPGLTGVASTVTDVPRTAPRRVAHIGGVGCPVAAAAGAGEEDATADIKVAVSAPIAVVSAPAPPPAPASSWNLPAGSPSLSPDITPRVDSTSIVAPMVTVTPSEQPPSDERGALASRRRRQWRQEHFPPLTVDAVEAKSTHSPPPRPASPLASSLAASALAASADSEELLRNLRTSGFSFPNMETAPVEELRRHALQAIEELQREQQQSVDDSRPPADPKRCSIQ